MTHCWFSINFVQVWQPWAVVSSCHGASVTCREETESNGVLVCRGQKEEWGEEGSLLTYTFVLRHSIAISLCAIVIHLVHDDFFLFLSLFLKDSLGVTSTADRTQNEWIQRTNLDSYTQYMLFFWSFSKSQDYTCFLGAYQTTVKTRRKKNNERTVINLRVYVCFCCRLLFINL